MAMPVREASCSCGQLRVRVEGEPLRVSICHCFACQRRTGSAFGVQSRFNRDQVQIEGESRQYSRASDETTEKTTFHFCPECGATVYYDPRSMPELIAIPVGAFADRNFPQPTVSVWEERKHEWVVLPDGVEHVY